MPLPKLYTELADWWPLFSNPDGYAQEAAWILEAIRRTIGSNPANILELGSGGGNTASHLTAHSRMTLVDPSAAMLEVSRRLNPDVEHFQGDMRAVRLGRIFDAVLIHDAIMYMTTESDLVAALSTARAHLRAGGALVVVPDYVVEMFAPKVDSGGRDAPDGSGRGLRYLVWTHAPAVGESMHQVDYAILLCGADGSVQVVHDRHTLGLFTREVWSQSFVRAGFARPRICGDHWKRDVFIANACGG
jgi:SAM-dependent methyltransferase